MSGISRLVGDSADRLNLGGTGRILATGGIPDDSKFTMITELDSERSYILQAQLQAVVLVLY